MPDTLKTRDVCKKCNNDLGLFVDAAFEKNWLVNNHLIELAYDFFDPNVHMGLPLRCMGNTNLCFPGMREDEICESWLGPLGEQVFWIRPKDERLYWYSGGNPRTVKKAKTRAYFLASERTLKNPALTWYTFRDSFQERNVRKIMYSVWEDADPRDIGFSEADEFDKHILEYLHENHG